MCPSVKRKGVDGAATLMAQMVAFGIQIPKPDVLKIWAKAHFIMLQRFGTTCMATRLLAYTIIVGW